MESHIKIKATVQEMREFFEKDSGVRYYEIKDKRYTQAELDAMSNEKYNKVEEIERKRREAFEKEMEKA